MDNVCNRCLFSIPSKVEMAEEQGYLRCYLIIIVINCYYYYWLLLLLLFPQNSWLCVTGAWAGAGYGGRGLWLGCG